MNFSPNEDFVMVEKKTLDIFFPKVGEYFRAVCLNNGMIGPRCPNNDNSLCCIQCFERPRLFYHAWDGKNAWKCPCG